MACTSEEFPAGLKVLVVDDDVTSLRILEKMLQKCKYTVTICSEARAALNLLRQWKGYFDVVLSDVHMPGMDGFRLLELVGLEMDLPVIMMSVDDNTKLVMRGIKHGACDYLIKPVRYEELKNIWQHVVRKKKRSHSKDEDVTNMDNDHSTTSKKPRVLWSVELHRQFVSAVNQLGIDKAAPRKILEKMNVPSLTRDNVASHLQKYRLYLKRLSKQQSLPTSSYCGPVEQNLKLALATSDQLPPLELPMSNISQTKQFFDNKVKQEPNMENVKKRLPSI